MPDQFESNRAGLDSPVENAAAVTPDNDNDLDTVTRALWVGGSGNISLDTVGGDTVTISGISAGTLLPIRVARVRSTSTTATNIVALW